MAFWRNLALYNLLNSKEKKEVAENFCLDMLKDKIEDDNEVELCDCDEELDKEFSEKIDNDI